jgi:hypothetical protein
VWSLDRARHLQGLLGRQVDRIGLVADHSLAGVAGRRSRAVAARTADSGRGTAGAAPVVGRGSGCGWHRSPDRTGSGPEERRGRAAGEPGYTGHVSEGGTGSVCLLAAAHGVAD